jgi:hypothetical protein
MNKLLLALSLVCIAGSISAADTEKKRMTREEKRAALIIKKQKKREQRAALALQKAMSAKEQGKHKTYKNKIKKSAKLGRPTAVLSVVQDETTKRPKQSSHARKKNIERLKCAVSHQSASEETKIEGSALLADLYDQLPKTDPKCNDEAVKWKALETNQRLQRAKSNKAEVEKTLEKDPNEYALDETKALSLEQLLIVMDAQIN